MHLTGLWRSTKGMASMTSAAFSGGAGASPGRYPAGARAFPHRDLLAIAQLERHEILYLLDEAEQWVQLNRSAAKRSDLLAGLTVINAFFENSTRTLLSFEIAGKRLGADVVNMHTAQSSVKKGETLIVEYIPARRESAEPVHGRANQALASYQSTANLPVDHEAEGIFGIDLYA